MLNPSARLLAFLVGAVLLSVGSAMAASLAKRTSDAAGVRVAVAPKANIPGGAVWEFEVVMDTHTKPLNDDLTKSAILLDGTGARHSPVEWRQCRIEAEGVASACNRRHHLGERFPVRQAELNEIKPLGGDHAARGLRVDFAATDKLVERRGPDSNVAPQVGVGRGHPSVGGLLEAAIDEQVRWIAELH